VSEPTRTKRQPKRTSASGTVSEVEASERVRESEGQSPSDKLARRQLRVSDNGAGIDPAIVAGGRDAHFGLRAMKERAERIDARLTIDSAAQAGTTVTLVVPGRVASSSGATSPRPSRLST